MKRLLVLCAFVFSLTACVMGPMPQSVKEFRDAMSTSKSMFTKSESFEVNRSFGKVYRDIAKYSKQCLNFKVTSTTRRGYAVSTMVTYYSALAENPVKGKGQMAIQVHTEGAIQVKKEPEGGYYQFLMDMTRKGKKKTLVEMHGPSMGYKHIVKALTSIAKGKKVKECPPE